VPKPKKSNKTSSKRSVKVRDLRPGRNPKGGAAIKSGATIKMGSTYLKYK